MEANTSSRQFHQETESKIIAICLVDLLVSRLEIYRGKARASVLKGLLDGPSPVLPVEMGLLLSSPPTPVRPLVLSTTGGSLVSNDAFHV